MLVSRHSITLVAREYLGTKHVHHGRIKHVGIDCAGLLICVCKELGLIDQSFDFFDYAFNNDGFHLERLIREYADEIDIADAKEGDVIIMNVYVNPQHCGFLTDKGMIHSFNKVVEHNIDDKWGKRFVKAFHIRGVEL